MDNLARAVKRGQRPVIPADAPADLASITKACWANDPAARPTLALVLVDLKSSVHEDGVVGSKRSGAVHLKRSLQENGAVVGSASGGAVGARGTGGATGVGVLTTAVAS